MQKLFLILITLMATLPALGATTSSPTTSESFNTNIHKKSCEEEEKWKIAGIIQSAIATALTAACIYLYLTKISPEEIDKFIEMGQHEENIGGKDIETDDIENLHG